MSLLSEAEKRAIRDAVKSVTDTFMVTPVVYHKSDGGLDSFQEDIPNEVFNSFILNALVEYAGGTISDEIKASLQGSIDFHDVKLTFNLEDIDDMGLLNADFSHTFVQEADYFTLKNKVYKVTDIYYDGPLDAKDVLIIVTGKLSDTHIKFNTVTIPDGDGGTTTGTVDELIAQFREELEQHKEETDGIVNGLDLLAHYILAKQ